MVKAVENTPEKFHFFMSCIEMTVVDTEGQTMITRGNSVIQSRDGNVPVRLLGKAQQSAFAQLMHRMQDPKLQLLHASFIAVNPLGVMSSEEFHQMPQLQDALKVQNG